MYERGETVCDGGETVCTWAETVCDGGETVCMREGKRCLWEGKGSAQLHGHLADEAVELLELEGEDVVVADAAHLVRALEQPVHLRSGGASVWGVCLCVCLLLRVCVNVCV